MAEKINDISAKIVEAGMWDAIGRGARAVGRFFDPRSSGMAKNLLMGIQQKLSEQPVNMDEIINYINKILPQIQGVLSKVPDSQNVLNAVKTLSSVNKNTWGNAIRTFRTEVASFLQNLGKQEQQAKTQPRTQPQAGKPPMTDEQKNQAASSLSGLAGQKSTQQGSEQIGPGAGGKEYTSLLKQILNVPALKAKLIQRIQQAGVSSKKIKIAAGDLVDEFLSNPKYVESVKKLMTSNPTLFGLSAPPVATTRVEQPKSTASEDLAAGAAYAAGETPGETEAPVAEVGKEQQINNNVLDAISNISDPVVLDKIEKALNKAKTKKQQKQQGATSVPPTRQTGNVAESNTAAKPTTPSQGIVGIGSTIKNHLNDLGIKIS